MARGAIAITTIDPATGNAVSGASVTVRKRSDNSLATLYQAETGATTVANPASTDANGRMVVWADRNAYKCDISGGGLTAYTEYVDVAPAGDGTLDVVWAANELMPIGVVLPYSGPTAPTAKWLLCQGQAISRTTYAGLFAVIGTSYGTGDGSTTFNLPDLRGRVPIGSGTGSGLTARTLGASGGNEAEVLATTHLPAHSHTGVTGNENSSLAHSHTTQVIGEGPSPGIPNSSRGLTDQHDFQAQYTFGSSTNGPPAHTHSFTTANTGGGTGHPNMPPFRVINYIIRVL